MAKLTNEAITLPDFSCSYVQSIDGQWVEENIQLSTYQQNSQGLILYFYPKDNTSGCTTQAVDFTQMSELFSQIGYDIIGVSKDSIASHKKFIEKHQLSIKLISDEDEKLCQYFDVIREKNMYGKKVLGLVRSVFVFNTEGKLTHLQRNIRAKGYADRLLDTLSNSK